MRSLKKKAIIYLPIFGGLFFLGAWLIPTTTRQGINYQVSEIRLPLGLKVLDFFQRHWHMRRIAWKIFRDCKTPSERAEAAFQWVRKNIRPQPSELPVVDDHVWHIVIRGYGKADQIADVFCTLCNYGGLPAFFFWDATPERHVWAAVKTEAGWTVCRPADNLRWVDRGGTWMALAELSGQPNFRETITSQNFPSATKFEELSHSARSAIQAPLGRLRTFLGF